MFIQRILLASTLPSLLATLPTSVFAQSQEKTLSPVVVTAAPFNSGEDAQILAPAKVLSGDELRNKLGVSLGDTLSRELGVSSSAFGPAASRPVIRGLEGPRIKILQNGMSVLDVATLSNDHAVGAETSTARQVEILRGPAALLYGSGAIGGLVNIVNDRIPSVLTPAPTGEMETRVGTADRERSLSFSADTSSGPFAFHVDGTARNTSDYRIPGLAVRNDPGSASGRLPSSYSRARNLGAGASYIADWGHLGASVDVKDDRYGIPTDERSFITLSQNRYDIDALVKQPLAGFESLRIKLGHTDYKHTENEQNGTPIVDFKNKAFESRWELTHAPISGWLGTFGIQTENSRFSALAADGSGAKTVPVTDSSSIAGFLVEQRDFGPVRINAGARLESVKRRPDAAARRADRDFNLQSYSVGGLWTFMPGYAFGPTLSLAERAPAIEELYSNGAHESTKTFDIGDASLRKEKSRNIELTLQKTQGPVRWKTNLFQNHVDNFVFGRYDGVRTDESGAADPNGELSRRFWAQGDAVIKGAEAEITYNQQGEGMSLRAFADTSRGKLRSAGSLPLQPATRFGFDAGYKQGPWLTGLSVIRAKRQDRLATFETTATPAYTQLDGTLSYSFRHGANQVTLFALARNLLDEDIRLSTSVLRESAPLAGRNFIFGARVRF